MTFINDDFLLQSESARILYHDYAEDMPVYDFHCHLPAGEIANNIRYENATHIWLGGDHYKWRLMRSFGVSEDLITGTADPFDKFKAWSHIVPRMIGNPMYHWTHLELARYFGIDELLGPDTAKSIWKKINRALGDSDFSARNLITRSNVTHLCTTDDPTDSLVDHLSLKADDSFSPEVTPTFRPDRALALDSPAFISWLEKLQKSSGVSIRSTEDLLMALKQRLDFFHSVGCRLSDHALDVVSFITPEVEKVESALTAALNSDTISPDEMVHYQSWLMLFFASYYTDKSWVMQLHIGAMRNNNTAMFNKLGPDSGFDAIADRSIAEPLSQMLDAMCQADFLPKTILYCLNPRDNEVIASLLGCYQGSEIPGKIQFGSGWWFNDQKDGMLKQLTTLANLGLLSEFVGMLTDSRSFLSYPRHEYFRRILCNLVGNWIEEGEYPTDYKLAGGIIRDISYRNAYRYFGDGPETE